MTNNLEREIINLVAVDRLYIPSSSFDGKLKRRREKYAKEIELPKDPYKGERAYGRVVESDKNKSRGMREGIEKVCEEFPKYGKILNGYIEEERVVREKHLFFGMNEGKRLTNNDYMNVLSDLGLSPVTAEKYCEIALDISRNLTKKRDEKERSVLIG